MGIGLLALDAFRAAPLTTEPFSYLIVPEFVRADALPPINAAYPDISSPGSFPVSRLTYGSAFRELIGALESDEFREAFEEKFNVDLGGKPRTITVRGQCGIKDGQIHTDSRTKIITVLIYLNEQWEDSGGRLRLLRSGNDLDDVITEVPPNGGTLLAFKRAANSWHGHRGFVGRRRVIQLNWVNSEWDQRLAGLRHHASASLKSMLAALRPGSSSRSVERAD
jgi:SM-20-related protein